METADPQHGGGRAQITIIHNPYATAIARVFPPDNELHTLWIGFI